MGELTGVQANPFDNGPIVGGLTVRSNRQYEEDDRKGSAVLHIGAIIPWVDPASLDEGDNSAKLRNSMLRRALFAFSIAASLGAQGLPVPRKAAEFVVHSSDGRSRPLSGYAGKVVLLSCIHTTWPHCQQM